ncbi:hypothetical protein [Sphingomonas sp. SRS2]|uniref:hypothetical protein n=1 Tax=Sphingomonas sp. SRS2 TaxID=133190 RepID=UPI0006184F05|nr:hypothetical protein [Sphingomonas sp. SRS2]KKC24863.1 hypothetical protein WP12_16645 [Sphingomonas sp. SRS2]
MKSTTTLPPYLNKVAAIYCEYQRRDADEDAIKSRVDEVETRRAALQGRLSALHATKPSPPANVDDGLVAAIAADPTVEAGGDVISAAVNRQAEFRAAEDAWRAGVSLVEQALSRIDDEIASIYAEKPALSEARGEAWQSFVRTAHDILVEQFIAEFSVMAGRLLDPIVALSRLKNGQDNTIVPGGACTIDKATIVRLRHYQEVHTATCPYSGERSVSTMNRGDILFAPTVIRHDQADGILARFKASFGAEV